MKVEKPSAVLEKAHAQLSKKTPCKCVGKLVFECHLSFKIKEGMWRDLVSIEWAIPMSVANLISQSVGQSTLERLPRM